MAEVENNKECSKILETRMLEGVLPQAKLVEDVRGYSAKGTEARGVTAGFPWQARSDLILYYLTMFGALLCVESMPFLLVDCPLAGPERRGKPRGPERWTHVPHQTCVRCLRHPR